jgi:hypothetical protein
MTPVNPLGRKGSRKNARIQIMQGNKKHNKKEIRK